MNFLPASPSRKFILLAPKGQRLNYFRNVTSDSAYHDQLLTKVQRFRGSIYHAGGHLCSSLLSHDARHIQKPDYTSWHFLTIIHENTIAACNRMQIHGSDVCYEDLTISNCALAKSPDWCIPFRDSINREIDSTRKTHLKFAELGGWAISPDLRCSTEAVRMILMSYALGRIIGGVSGISTAGADYSSASILRRLGGRRLMFGDQEFPTFYESAYRAELEVLRFDSFSPSQRYEEHIQNCVTSLQSIQVITPENLTEIFTYQNTKGVNFSSKEVYALQ